MDLEKDDIFLDSDFDLDDDFGDVVEEQPKKAQPKKEEPVAPVIEDSGFSEIEFGETVSRYAFDKFKMSKDSKVQIRVLTKRVAALKTHYNENVGSYLCFEGACCDIDGYSRMRYAMPVIVFDCNKDGKIVSKKMTINILTLGQDKYQELVDMNNEGYDILETNIRVSCSDEKYQKYSFMPVATKIEWKKWPDAKKIVEEWNEKRSKAYESVARRITPEAYEAALNRSRVGTGRAEVTVVSDDIIDLDDAIE